MKLLSYRFQNTDRAALWVGGQAYDVASLEAPLGPDMAGLLANWEASSQSLRVLEQALMNGSLQATPLVLNQEDWLSRSPGPHPAGMATHSASMWKARAGIAGSR